LPASPLSKIFLNISTPVTVEVKFSAPIPIISTASPELAHAYVFTKFLDHSQKKEPYIKLEDMWNPFLDAKAAVGNSVVMDSAAGGTSNIILIGPNAGGKSTFLMGMMTSYVLLIVRECWELCKMVMVFYGPLITTT